MSESGKVEYLFTVLDYHLEHEEEPIDALTKAIEDYRDVYINVDTRPPVVRAYDVAQRRIDEERLQHVCGNCGNELQLVRPGKYQCIECERKTECSE